MLIEKLAVDEKKPGRFTLFFDNGVEFKVSANQIADFGLYTGKELAENEYDALCNGLRQSTSKARAMRMLGSRNLSTREIERRLVSKGDTDETARDTVEWLGKIGAVNDEEYAAGIAAHYSSKGYGIARIRSELFRRGIPRELWDEALDNIKNQSEAIDRYLEKKLKGSDDKYEVRKAVNSLCARGFSYGEAREAVRSYLENQEDNSDID